MTGSNDAGDVHQPCEVETVVEIPLGSGITLTVLPPAGLRRPNEHNPVEEIDASLLIDPDVKA